MKNYYYNPPERIAEIGRKLEFDEDTHGFAELTAQLQGDEKLFGLYDRLLFKNGVWIRNEETFNEFETQYNILTIGYYALTPEQAGPQFQVVTL